MKYTIEYEYDARFSKTPCWAKVNIGGTYLVEGAETYGEAREILIRRLKDMTYMKEVPKQSEEIEI